MKIIAFLILVIFAVYGFSEFLHSVKLFLVFPKRKTYSHITVNLKNGIAEKQLLYVYEQYRWYGKSFADYIVPNFDALNEDSYNRCKEIVEKYDVKF